MDLAIRVFLFDCVVGLRGYWYMCMYVFAYIVCVVLIQVFFLDVKYFVLNMLMGLRLQM